MKNYFKNKEYSLKTHEKHHPLESMCAQSMTLSSKCPDVTMLQPEGLDLHRLLA